jgi:hypothetical protein
MDGDGIAILGDRGYSNATVVHYSDRFPIVATACGLTRAPATDDWAGVDCGVCIELRVSYREVEPERAGPKSSNWTAAPSMKSAVKRR